MAIKPAAPQGDLPLSPPVRWTWREHLPGLSRLAPAVAAALLLLSLAMPYWSLTLHAPQYPEGLDATIFTTHLAGDVDEIDELNHYIGMMKLGDAARVERDMAPVAIVGMAALALLAMLLRRKWAILLELPIVGFPFAFALDLYYWLYRAGHDLDHHAALSSSVAPFTPAILGVGQVGQFSTTAAFEGGFYLAVLAALVVILGAAYRLRRNGG